MPPTSEGRQNGDSGKPRVRLDVTPGGAPIDIVLMCDDFWRCLKCGSISGGPSGFKTTHCWCGGESFAVASKGEMLAQGGPFN